MGVAGIDSSSSKSTTENECTFSPCTFLLGLLKYVCKAIYLHHWEIGSHFFPFYFNGVAISFDIAIESEINTGAPVLISDSPRCRGDFRSQHITKKSNQLISQFSNEADKMPPSPKISIKTNLLAHFIYRYTLPLDLATTTVAIYYKRSRF